MNSNTALVVQDMDTQTLGTMLAKSGYFADASDAAKAVVKVLAGAELGFPPIASMTGIYIVKGKVSLSANMMAAAVKRSGRYTYKVLKLEPTECSIEFYERNGTKLDSLGVSTFTREDATKAGTQNMDRFPRNMLFARAMSNGAKWFCPDVFGGGPIYTPEELGAKVNEDGEVIDVTPTVKPADVLAAQSEADWQKIAETKREPVNGNEPAQDFPKATEAQIKKLGALVRELYPKPEDMTGFREYMKHAYGVDSRKDLTVGQASDLIDMLVKQQNGEPV